MNIARLLLVPVLCATAAYAQQGTPPPADQQGTPPATQAAPLPDSPDAGVKPALQPTGPTAVFDTSMGRLTCKLYAKEAPQTVANFIGLAEGTRDWTDPVTHEKVHGRSLYNGTAFHRVIPGFMIQGGDPMGTGEGDPGYMFGDEFNPDLNFDVPGRLAMANSGPDTNGSQFFITEVPTPHLNQKHTIFGQCDDPSILIVKSIARVETDAQDKPTTPVVLNKLTIVPEGQPLPPPPVAASEAAPAATPSNAPARPNQ
jgi:peptidyl-prolyl cis-trans isomerase A (cyclophilin A)